MKRDLVFWILGICAAVLFLADIVFAVVYTVYAASFASGALFPAESFLPLSVVLIVLNALLALSSAGYFILRRVFDKQPS